MPNYSASILDRALRSNFLRAIMLLFAVSFLTLPSLSHAQAMGDLPTLEQIQGNAGSSNGANADESRKILSSMLGEFGDNPLGSVGQADHLLGNLFFVFNSVLFVVGISFVIYCLVMAVAESAHEGEVLGKRMNGLWIPIRFGTGIFGMLPVFKGFSLAQAIMMSIAILGIGLANMLVTVAIDANDQFDVVIPAPGLASAPQSVSIDDNVANSLFIMNVCRYAANHHINLLRGGDAQEYVTATIDDEGTVKVKGAGIDCGGLSINKDESVLREQGGVFSGYRNPAVQYDEINRLANFTHEQRKASIDNIQVRVEQLANQWYQTVLSGQTAAYPIKELMAAANAVNNTEKAAVKAQIESTADSSLSAVKQSTQERMREGGWTSVASWYSIFAESNAAIQSAALSSQVIVNQPNFEQIKLPEEVQNSLRTLIVQQNKAKDSCTFTTENEIGECSVGQNVLKDWIIDPLLADTGGSGMVNPIIAAKNIGDWLLVGVGTIMAIKPAGKFVSWLGEKFTPVGKLVSFSTGAASGIAKKFFGWMADIAPDGFAGRLAGVLFIGALVTGLIYAVYIPFIPFLTWFSALVSYFASVIEGLIAAQVWAFSHLNSDGEGMGQKTEKGYIYVLNMLLRPGLMVLGFFFASAILTLMGTFFLKQFGPALANVQGDTMTGPFIMIGALGVVMIALISMIQTIFNLVYEVPDRVIAWFGHGMEARMAQNMDRNIESKTEGMARWGGNSALAETIKGKAS